MKFLADVNIAQSVIRFLRDRNHDVLDAKRNLLLEPDTKIINLTKLENRIILTRDKDFMELVKMPKYHTPTVIFRLTDQKPDNIKAYLEKLLADTKEEVLGKSLIIVNDNNTEIIPLTKP